MTTASPAGASADRVLSVVFQLDGETYVIPTHDVLKVVEITEVSRLPRLPPAIVGITHHRGRVITVVELGLVLFGGARAARAKGRGTHVLLLDRGQRNAGVLVDGIEEITPVRWAGARAGPTESLRVLQHRGRAVNAIVTDALVSAIEELASPAP